MDTTIANTKTNLKTVKTHCKTCWKVQPHLRTIRDGLEVLRCKKCGTEQHYAYTGTQPEEE